MDALAAFFTAGLAAYLVYLRPNTASNVGFSLVMAGQQRLAPTFVETDKYPLVGFSSQILWFVRVYNRLEVAGSCALY